MRFPSPAAVDAVTVAGVPSIVGVGTVEFLWRPDSPQMTSAPTHHLWGFRSPDAETIIRQRADTRLSILPRTTSGFLAEIISVRGFVPGDAVRVSWVLNGADGRLYLDGALDTVAALSSAVTVLVPASGAVRIGSYNVAEPVNGFIRDVRLWNVARSQEQILRGIADGIAGTEVGLVGWWPLDLDARNAVVKATPRPDGVLVGAARSQLALR